MTTGDAASAAGMDLVPGSTLAKDIDDEINKTRDYVANAGTSAATPDTVMRRSSTGHVAGVLPTSPNHLATKGYADSVGTSAATGDTVMRRTASGHVAVAEPTSAAHVATKGYVDGKVNNGPVVDQPARDSAGNAQNTANAARNGQMLSDVYGRTLGGQYRSLYVGADGLLGWVASSRSKKKNIKPAEIDIDAVLGIEIVTFLYRVAIDPDGIVQHGVIAEQLDELGLDWLVDYGVDGQPEGVRYDRLALAILPVVQSLAQRVTALEGGNHATAE